MKNLFTNYASGNSYFFPMNKLKKASEIFVVAIISTIFSLFVTYPSFQTLSTRYIGDGGDNYEYASYIGLAARNVQHGLFPFISTSFWRFPVGFDFSRGFDSYLTLIIGTSLYFLTNLVTTYNITIFILMTFNGILSYFFFKILTNSRLLALLGTIMYGFSFYVIAKAASHPNLLFVGGFPLLGISIIKIIKEKTLNISTIFIFFASLIVISLGSTQYFIMSILFLLLYSLTLAIIYKSLFRSIRLKINKKKVEILTIGFFATVILVLFFFPHIAAIIAGKFIFLKREGTLSTLTPSLLDYLLPNKYLHILPAKFATSPSSPSIEKAVYVGFTEFIFFLMFFLKPNITSTFKKSLFILFLIPFLLSLGYGNSDHFFLLPYHFLDKIFPFNLIVETGRYVVVYGLFITVAILVFLRSISSRWLQVMLGIILLGGILMERIPVGYYSVSDLFDNYTKVVASQPSHAVLDLPINFYYPKYNILSFYYNKPIVNGYFHWSADGESEKSFVASNGLTHFICRKDISYPVLSKNEIYTMLNALKKSGITTIVVHKDDKFYFPDCSNVRQELSNLIPIVVSTPATSIDKESEIVLNGLTGKQEFNFYTPSTGTFYIGGIYLAPKNYSPFNILLNGNPVGFNYGFITAKDNSMQLFPTHSISFPVVSGDVLTLKGKNIADSTYLSLWYRYIPDENAIASPLRQPIVKVFEDKKAIVYSIQ